MLKKIVALNDTFGLNSAINSRYSNLENLAETTNIILEFFKTFGKQQQLSKEIKPFNFQKQSIKKPLSAKQKKFRDIYGYTPKNHNREMSVQELKFEIKKVLLESFYIKNNFHKQQQNFNKQFPVKQKSKYLQQKSNLESIEEVKYAENKYFNSKQYHSAFKPSKLKIKEIPKHKKLDLSKVRSKVDCWQKKPK